MGWSWKSVRPCEYAPQSARFVLQQLTFASTEHSLPEVDGLASDHTRGWGSYRWTDLPMSCEVEPLDGSIWQAVLVGVRA